MKSPNVRHLPPLRGFALTAFALVFVAISGQPATATAGPAAENALTISTLAERGAEAQFAVQASHGYRITISISKKGALLVARKGHAAALYSPYAAKIKGDQFSATFGRLGKVRVRFHESQGRRGIARRSLLCGRGDKSISGVFIGEVRFRGERGFTKTDKTRAFGAIRLPRKRGAKDCDPMRGKEQSPSLLDAHGKYRLTGFFLGGRKSVRFAGGPGAISEIIGWERQVGVPLGLAAIAKQPVPFTAVGLRREPGLQVVRLAAAGGSEKALAIGRNNVAQVNPPAPFVGSGQMDICRLTSWHGDLRIHFPGESVLLTTSTFWVAIKTGPPSPC
jgi:hypothetical protein